MAGEIRFSIYQDVVRHLGDARFSVITDDVASRRAIDDAWTEGVTFVTRQAAWRHALVYAGIAGVASTYAGYAFKHDYPTDWLRTHAVYVVDFNDGREHPIDIREVGRSILSNKSLPVVRYVSNLYLDPDLSGNPWPEHFKQAVVAYLAFLTAERITGEAGASVRMSSLFSQLLGEAVRIDAEPDGLWLPHQRDGSMLRAARALLKEGDWRFAMVTAHPVTGGLAAPGYTRSFSIPSDWLRTHSIFIASAGDEYPVDVREQGDVWSTNDDGISVRYVSAVRGLDSALWPEPFMNALLRVLQDGRQLAPQQPKDSQQSQMSPAHEAVAVALAAESLPLDQWLPFQRDGSMLRGVRELLQEGYWRFALTTITPPAGGTPAVGYSHSFNIPSDWLRTHAIFISSVGDEIPIDAREQGAVWSTNDAGISIRYVSATRGTNSALWPKPFMATLLHMLQNEPQQAPAQGQQQPAMSLFRESLARALAAESLPPDAWLGFQLDGTFETAKQFVMQQGYWVYRGSDNVLRGLKEVQYSSLDDQLPTMPSYSLPYRYPLPADWFKTHALFIPWDGQECPINIRENAHDWSTDAGSFVARYLATDVLDARYWPQAIRDAVYAYAVWQTANVKEQQVRAQAYAVQLAAALKAHSRPVDDYLRFQLDGRFEQEKRKLIESGRWRFAIKTVSLTESSDPIPAEEAEGLPSDSYAYRFIVPNDDLRVVSVYYLRGSGRYADRLSIDYRDEGSALHANFTPISVRYVSRLALDSTKWPAAFRIALRAYLLHIETPTDLVLKKNYEDACRDAEALDDARDMPAVRGSRIVAARYGRGNVAREQGWWPQ